MPALPLPPQPSPAAYAVPAGLAELRASVKRQLAHLASPKGNEDSRVLRLRLSQSRLEGPKTQAMNRSLVKDDHDPLEDTVCPDYAN
jgi:hypothetical protein